MQTPPGRGLAGPLALPMVLAVTALAGLQRYLNGWTLDDERLIFSPRMHDLANAPALFVHNAMWAAGGDGSEIDTYRPLSLLSFLLDIAWGGPSPWVFHTTNLALHLAATAFVFALAHRLSHHRLASALAGLMFGVNAGVAEAHVWINGRSDALMTVLGLTLALGWLRWRGARPGLPRIAGAAAIALGALAACLAKETFLLALPAFPLLAFADDAVHERPQRGIGRHATDALPLAIGAAICVGLRVHVLSGVGAGTGATPTGVLLAWLPVVWWDALLSMIFPLRQGMRMLAADYALLPRWTPVVAWLGFAGLVATLPRLVRRAPAVAAALVLHGCTLAPVVLLAHSTWPGMARYGYLAAAFGAVGLATVLPRWLDARATRLVLAAVLALHALVMQLHIAAYRDAVSFGQTMVDENPRAIHGHLMLARVAMDEARFDDAVAHFDAAVATGWPHCKAWDGWLASLLQAGRIEEGLGRIAAADAACPDDPRVGNVAGLLHEAAGADDVACARWQACACSARTHDAAWCERNLVRRAASCGASNCAMVAP